MSKETKVTITLLTLSVLVMMVVFFILVGGESERERLTRIDQLQKAKQLKEEQQIIAKNRPSYLINEAEWYFLNNDVESGMTNINKILTNNPQSAEAEKIRKIIRISGHNLENNKCNLENANNLESSLISIKIIVDRFGVEKLGLDSGSYFDYIITLMDRYANSTQQALKGYIINRAIELNVVITIEEVSEIYKKSEKYKSQLSEEDKEDWDWRFTLDDLINAYK